MRQQDTQHQVAERNCLLSKLNRDGRCNQVKSHYCSVYLIKYCNLTPAALELHEVHHLPIFIQECSKINLTGGGKSAGNSNFLGLSPSHSFSYSETAWEVTQDSLRRGARTLLTQYSQPSYQASHTGIIYTMSINKTDKQTSSCSINWSNP